MNTLGQMRSELRSPFALAAAIARPPCAGRAHSAKLPARPNAASPALFGSPSLCSARLHSATDNWRACRHWPLAIPFGLVAAATVLVASCKLQPELFQPFGFSQSWSLSAEQPSFPGERWSGRRAQSNGKATCRRCRRRQPASRAGLSAECRSAPFCAPLAAPARPVGARNSRWRWLRASSALVGLARKLAEAAASASRALQRRSRRRPAALRERERDGRDELD